MSGFTEHEELVVNLIPLNGAHKLFSSSVLFVHSCSVIQQ